MSEQYLNKTGLSRLWARIKAYADTKLSVSGGTMTGDFVLQKHMPRLTLAAAEKQGVGRSRTVLYKNANASADSGTVLSDYAWGDGSSGNTRLNLTLSRNQTLVKNMMRLVLYYQNGGSKTYLLYGEHNPPAVADVDGLEGALEEKAAAEDLNALAVRVAALESERNGG